MVDGLADGMIGLVRRSEFRRSASRISVVLGLVGVFLVVGGCDAFNPAFVDFVGSNFDAIPVNPQGPDSRGHVVVAFRNDTVFDEQMLMSLVDRGLDSALTQTEGLRPRVRMLVLITFTTGEQILVEFNDGSATILDPSEDASNFPDLIQTQQDNIVVQCDVARVELVGLPSIFVPVQFETIRIETGDLNTQPFRVQVSTTPPGFVTLRVDDVDAFGNTTVRRNVDIRDRPAPAIGPNCGSVVTITLAGTLRVPFERNEFDMNVPGVLDTNNAALAASPGRFSIIVGIR